MSIVKRQLANLGITNFQLVANIVGKHFVNLVIILISKETLTKGADTVAKDYFEYFIKDFLCISNQTLEKIFQVSEVVRIPVEKTFNVKSYHKSDKNRSQVVYKKFDNCEKLSYTVKGKPRTFYKKF